MRTFRMFLIWPCYMMGSYIFNAMFHTTYLYFFYPIFMVAYLCLPVCATVRNVYSCRTAKLLQRTRLVTCSADSSIRLWEYRSGASSGQNESQEINLLSMSHGKLRGSSLKGEMLALLSPSNAFQQLVLEIWLLTVMQFTL